MLCSYCEQENWKQWRVYPTFPWLGLLHSADTGLCLRMTVIWTWPPLLSPGLVCLPTPRDNPVKSLFTDWWSALPACLHVASRLVSLPEGRDSTLHLRSLTILMQCLTYSGGSYVVCGNTLLVLKPMNFTICISGKDLKTLFKPNPKVHLFSCF